MATLWLHDAHVYRNVSRSHHIIEYLGVFNDSSTKFLVIRRDA